MPVLRNLSEEETKIFFHKLQNRRCRENFSNEGEFLTESQMKTIEAKLAKHSEEEHFAQKNRYRL